MSVDLDSFRQMFFEEAADLMAEFEAGLLKLDNDPRDAEVLNSVFRCAHSLKGGSATFGLAAVAHFTHSLETLLDQVRAGQIGLNPELLGLLLESLDHMKDLVAAGQSGDNSPDSTELIARIEEITQAEGDGGNDAISLSRVDVRFFPGTDVMRTGGDPLRIVGQLLDGNAVLSAWCDTSRLPALTDMDPLACYFGWNIEMLTMSDTDRLHEVLEFVAAESEIEMIVPLQVRHCEQARIRRGAAHIIFPAQRNGAGRNGGEGR